MVHCYACSLRTAVLVVCTAGTCTSRFYVRTPHNSAIRCASALTQRLRLLVPVLHVLQTSRLLAQLQ
jgi:hypothetical protein